MQDIRGVQATSSPSRCKFPQPSVLTSNQSFSNFDKQYRSRSDFSWSAKRRCFICLSHLTWVVAIERCRRSPNISDFLRSGRSGRQSVALKHYLGTRSFWYWVEKRVKDKDGLGRTRQTVRHTLEKGRLFYTHSG